MSVACQLGGSSRWISEHIPGGAHDNARQDRSGPVNTGVDAAHSRTAGVGLQSPDPTADPELHALLAAEEEQLRQLQPETEDKDSTDVAPPTDSPSHGRFLGRETT
jgi:hypothetical protein